MDLHNTSVSPTCCVLAASTPLFLITVSYTHCRFLLVVNILPSERPNLGKIKKQTKCKKILLSLYKPSPLPLQDHPPQGFRGDIYFSDLASHPTCHCNLCFQKMPLHFIFYKSLISNKHSTTRLGSSESIIYTPFNPDIDKACEESSFQTILLSQVLGRHVYWKDSSQATTVYETEENHNPYVKGKSTHYLLQNLGVLLFVLTTCQ